jgi:dihydrofolate reductase
MSKISAIVAIDKNNCIGKDNEIPWYLPADLKYFKKTTIDHPVIMGRKSFESIGRPLPKRTNIVISSNPFYIANGILIASNIEEALEMAMSENLDEVFIIGGGKIYQQTHDLWDRVYLTEVEIETEGDTFFPKLDPKVWQEISRETHEADDKNPFRYHFVILDRK